MRMQLQALIRAANGRKLTVMFPFVAQFDEFKAARTAVLDEIERERRMGHVLPEHVEIGAMLETPSLAFAPRQFSAKLPISVSIVRRPTNSSSSSFAADRENEQRMRAARHADTS